jgi:hypothetical protein
MGGTGSGRWTYHNKKRTVEECWAIDISEVARIVGLRNPGPTSGSLRPIKPATGKRMSPVPCALEVVEDSRPSLTLSYTIGGKRTSEHRAEQVVPLQSTQPNFGGVRWWFSCPRLVDDKECGRRVGKLYRLPEGRHFACRHCLNLTYESCQKSHRYDGLFALMAGEASGEAFETVKQAFAYQRKDAKMRRAASSPRLLDAFESIFNDGDCSPE